MLRMKRRVGETIEVGDLRLRIHAADFDRRRVTIQCQWPDQHVEPDALMTVGGLPRFWYVHASGGRFPVQLDLDVVGANYVRLSIDADRRVPIRIFDAMGAPILRAHDETG